MKRIFQIIGLMSLVALIGIIAIFGLYSLFFRQMLAFTMMSCKLSLFHAMVLSSLVILQKTTEDSESRHGTLPFISAAFNFTIFAIYE
jgi:hypothetical protein